jgi:hypothetical protein
MKRFFAVLFAVAVTAGVMASSAQAQTSNILVISQDANRVITVIRAADNGITGSWLSYSGQLSTTATAVEDRLFSGLAAGKVIIIRVNAGKTMTALLVDDPGLTGDSVVVDQALSKAVAAIKDRLYLGL